VAKYYHLIFTRKLITKALGEEQVHGTLRKALGSLDLRTIGVGAIIGAKDAGPAIVLSSLLSGMACAFAALCYSELASMIPVVGSAYTYSYVALGEIVAWIIGWDIVLEYIIGSSPWPRYGRARP
jgi:APA family basic amino acid/polyamine antiporter